MNGYETYHLFSSLRRHFAEGSDYDYFKYNGRIKYTPDKYNNRYDKHVFERLGKKPNPRNLILSNLLKDSRIWATDCLSAEAELIHTRWEKTQQSLQYTFQKDLGILDTDFNSNFVCKMGQYPNIINLMNQGKITMETAIILDKLTSYLDCIDKCISDRLIWPNIYQKMKRYSPFISIDRTIYSNVAINTFG